MTGARVEAGDAPFLARGGVRILILALFFLSGACGLVYEVVWMRMLTLVFGATSFATSTILAAFFSGLALGSFTFGRVVDRGGNPLKVYGWLEAGIGAFAFLMPLLFSALNVLYVGLYRALDLSFLQLSAFRFAFSFLVLLIPATLMGGTLPILLKLFVRRRGELGWNAGQLYAVNTLGAVVGTLSAGFFLILLLGLKEAAYLAGAVNLVIAGVVLVLARRHPVEIEGAPLEASPEVEAETADEAEGAYPPGLAKLALWTAGVSGFCALALEVFWTRALVYFLDNSSHAFSTMLTAFLLGIALGSLLISLFIDGRSRLVTWLGATQLLIAISAVLAIPILNHSTPVIERMTRITVDPLLPWKWMGLRFATSLSVMIVPTVLMGMTFPLAVKVYTRSLARAGTAVGNVYSVNTVAGVAGSLAAGFLLIPLMGVQRGILLVAAVNALMGLVLVLADPAAPAKERGRWAVGLGGAFTALAGFYLALGAPPLSSYYERMEAVEVLSYDEGVGSTVKVFRDGNGDKFVSIDGFPVAGTSMGMQDAQKSLAHVPMLLTPVDSPRVNIIGFGSGGTSSGIHGYGVERIDVVELVPGVIRAARHFREVNRSVLDEPNYHVIQGDGRNYALVSDETYDVISIDATSPKMAGNGSLYTREFYRLLRERLSDRGLLVQWLPFHLLSDEETRMTARTFQTVFPHTTLWLSPLRHHGVLVGTIEPLEIDVQRLREKLSLESTREELGPMFTLDPLDFLSWFVMGEEALAEYVGDVKLNTDDHPYLEFTPALAFFTAGRFQVQNLARFQEARESVLPLLSNLGDSEEERAAFRERLRKRFEATQFALRGDVFFYLGRRDDARDEYTRALLTDPESQAWLEAMRLF